MVGKTVSHYKIISKLGSGGMGEVYLAEDTKLKREVAIKFLPPRIVDNDEAKERFKIEAQAAAALNHANIATIYSIEETGSDTFIVMEYVKGRSLKEIIASSSLDLDKTIDFAVQITKGLSKAHEKGIIHRDIKPANIIISDEGTVKILDFGLAKISAGTMVTRAGTTMGTAACMSPEQATSDKVDHRTDLWSLGVVLYEMAEGKRPFKGEYESALLYSIVNTDPEPMTDVPINLQNLVLKSLEKKPDERYQSTKDFLKDLMQVKTNPEPENTVRQEYKPSIAVLPFRDMSPDKDQDYFCEGISEEIINALTHIENIKVIARTSAFVFKDKQEDMREIGKKLDVEHLLEGSIRKAGNRLRITAQLIKANDGSHLWSEKFDRDLEDVFAIQDEISLAIVKNLKIKMLAAERSAVVKRYTDNIEAHNHYLKGRFFYQKRTRHYFDLSIEEFKLAIKIDPDFAPAYSGLAEQYINAVWNRFLSIDEALKQSNKYLKQAMDIDDQIGEIRMVLANKKCWFDWDWKGAEAEYKRAIELSPSFAEGHHMYSHFLELLGHWDEAEKEMNKAIVLEPLTVNFTTCLGQVFYFSQDYERAVKQLKKAYDLDPDFYENYLWHGLAYTMKKEFEEAIGLLTRGMRFPELETRARSALAYTYAVKGDTATTEQLLDELLQNSEEKHVDPYCLAWIFAGLQDLEKMFEYLYTAYETRTMFLLFLKIDPILEIAHSDKRYFDIMQKMGLTEW